MLGFVNDRIQLTTASLVVMMYDLKKELSRACARAKGYGVSKGENAILPFGRRWRGFPAQAKSNQKTISVACGRVVEKNNYYQHIPASYFGKKSDGKDSENVVAYIKGSEKPDELIVLSAHLDHVGTDEDGNVYNGADDDGSGTVALLEMAEAFQKAVKDGNGPKRSILFLHVTGEEIGLFGSRYYTENPLFPLENTVCNLNSDMIGRIDPDKADNPNYIYSNN